jgi:N-acetylmuramic acid 6-phosphate etherase
MLDHLQTESRNPRSTHLDEMSPLEIVQLMNREDGEAVAAVATQAERIARAIDVIAERLARSGRLVYVGAGTSGRLGVLDATECPPTFSSPPEQVVGLIAGGPDALTRAVEGAEDHPEFGERDLRALNLGERDVLVGIATSGRTPYVLGAAEYARTVGAATIGLACNTDSELEPRVDLMICPVVGPEVLSGSTRLKAGTATKLVLNMLSTGAMVRLGKCYGNLMVDLRATNSKLRARTNRIVRLLTGVDAAAADALLKECGGELKTALVVQLGAFTPTDARTRLSEAGGRVEEALKAHRRQPVGSTAEDLVLGVDGGGSSTIALLAVGDRIVGRGVAGPSNLSAVGEWTALRALDDAVNAAFAAANRPRAAVRSACFGLAGADQELIRRWGEKNGIAKSVEVVADVALVLAAGAPDGCGVALVAGTGSIALGRAPDGRTARAGGWGYLFSDEGSGYALVLSALRAIAKEADGRGPPTALTAALLEALGVKNPSDLIPAVYRGNRDRAALAALAPHVLTGAEGADSIAQSIVEDGASALADLAAACARSLGFERAPLALGGGLLVGSAYYRRRVVDALQDRGIHPDPVALVAEPAEGAVKLASARIV